MAMKSALVITHPGHELRIHHWLELAKPEVCVLTDGSGRTQTSRLGSTTRVLSRTGATPGPIYGRYSDAEIYAAVKNGDSKVCTGLADELAVWIMDGGFDQVVGDAIEWYNTSHDICCYLISCASGFYQEMISYRDHIEPVRDLLKQYADTG